jgi:hypothetical protein
MKNIRTLLTLSLLASPLLADGPKHGFEAQASLVIASQDTNRMVDGNNLTGTSVGVAYRGELAAGLFHRVHVDLTGMKAKPETGMSGAAPKHLSFGWDIMQDVGKWSFYGGILGIKWSQSIDDRTSTNYRDLNLAGTSNSNNSPKGTKFGARFGVERSLTKNLCFVLGYTQTEFNKKLNPAWYSLGLSYRFTSF